MYKIVSTIILLLISISLSAEISQDSTEHRWTDNLYLGVATNRLAILQDVHNLSTMVGYQINKEFIIEYEFGVFNFNGSSRFNRLTFKFLQQNNDFFGVGFQYYSRIKTNNGIFSRFNGSYRQQMNYNTNSAYNRLFFVAGRVIQISKKINLGFSCSVGIGTVGSSFINLPEDANFIGSGKLFIGNPQSTRLKIDTAFKLFLQHRF